MPSEFTEGFSPSASTLAPASYSIWLNPTIPARSLALPSALLTTGKPSYLCPTPSSALSDKDALTDSAFVDYYLSTVEQRSLSANDDYLKIDGKFITDPHARFAFDTGNAPSPVNVAALVNQDGETCAFIQDVVDKQGKLSRVLGRVYLDAIGWRLDEYVGIPVQGAENQQGSDDKNGSQPAKDGNMAWKAGTDDI